MLDKFTREEIEEKIKNSKNIVDFLASINRSTSSGSNRMIVSQYIKDNNIDISHFENIITKRCPENIFVINSTASQNILRKYYKRGNYSEYKCAICGLEPFWNGQELTLTLDHINGINNDDRLENLRWVCPNCDRQLPTYGSKKLKKKILCKKCGKEISRESKSGLCLKCYWEENKSKTYTTNSYGKRVYSDLNKCIDCGKIIDNQSIRCNVCFNKNRLKEALKEREKIVTRDELKALIRNTPITHIAKQFNVTDNTIRKWAKKYNLPYQSSDISSYTNEQWDAIDENLHIYRVINLKNGSVFVGTSHIQNLTLELDRLTNSFNHKEYSLNPLQKAFVEFGKNSFSIELLETVETYSEATEKVSFYCEKLNSHNICNPVKEIIDENLVIDLYEKERNIRRVSMLINKDVSIIRNILKKNNIPTLTSAEIAKQLYTKSINMLSMDGNHIKKFDAVADAARFIAENNIAKYSNGAMGHIIDVCKGKRKSAYGYKWEYATSEKEDISNA